MLFKVLPARARRPSNSPETIFLLADRWDDRFKYNTQYDVFYKDVDDKEHSIGSVKIGQFGMKEDQSRPNIPETFESLDKSFFSIGQSENYYISLNALGANARENILTALQDLALFPDILSRALSEPVTETSLLRSITLEMIMGRFRRLALGDARLTSYKFSYKTPVSAEKKQKSPVLTFDVQPYSEPPSNIHVLIGRNGVGKTYYLTMMTRVLIANDVAEDVGTFTADVSNEDEGLFANLVSVAFSAFDPFDSLPIPAPNTIRMQYSYVGLKQLQESSEEETKLSQEIPKRWSKIPKDIETLTREFVESIRLFRKDRRLFRWQRALKILESDPIFRDSDVSSLALASEGRNWQKVGTSLFEKLSSGHKIVLLTITRLVEKVVERTLVLIDEPESHLHPPLLSAFIRSLSDLLIQQNGVAIIATHSPVVLQEVPKNCVWKLRRSGFISSAERLESETFGENVGILTREVFGLEVTKSGFHKMLQDAVEEYDDYESVVAHFDDQLGAEAKAIVRGLIASKKQP